MDIQTYSEFIYNLINPKILQDRDTALVYLSGKLANEATEVLALRLNGITDRNNRMDELGDVLWYLVNNYTLYSKKFNDVINTYGIYDRRTAIDYLTVATGKLSGETLKKVYHGKDISDQTLFAYLDACRDAFFNCLHELDISLDEVMEYNYNKLYKRHGESYNSSFYKKS